MSQDDDHSPAEEDSGEEEPRVQPKKGKGQIKGKGKGKGKAPVEGADSESDPGPVKERKSYMLPEGVNEDELIEWYEHTPAVWNCKVQDYKKRRHILTQKASELGITFANLEGWWRNIKDTVVRVRRKKSGQQADLQTDREKHLVKALAW